MAKRKINGKYVIGKHEASLYGNTLPDSNVTLSSDMLISNGGSFTGGSGAIKITGSSDSTPGLLRTTPVILSGTSETLTKASNGGRTNVLSMSADSTYTLPTPGAGGECYHFIYGGKDANSHQFRINTNLTSETFQGSLLFANTTADNGLTGSLARATDNQITASVAQL